MIHELTVHPKPQNNYAKILSLGAMVLAVICIVAYSLMDRYRGVVGLVAILFITTAVLIYTKYIAVEFYYDITFDSEGIPLFVVRQITGRRQTTLCRLELWHIDSVTHMTDKERREHKSSQGVRKYTYSPTVFPKDVYIIYAGSRYEKCEIIIECSAEYADMLRGYAAEAKTMYKEEDEE